MPRKHDPIAVQILRYFETAPLDAAELVLELARAGVEKRRPKKVERAGVATPITMPDPKGPPAPAVQPRRRRGVGQAAPADVPLPGLPGPMPVVGG